jgi:hypothetical protein
MKVSKLEVIEGELLYGGWTENPRLDYVATVDQGSGRWESYHLLVVKDEDGKLWGAEYSSGLTENQGTGPFDDLDDSDEIEFKPVEAKEVTTVTYEFAKPEYPPLNEPYSVDESGLLTYKESA